MSRNISTMPVSPGLSAILALKHAAGTAELYDCTLERLFNAVLHNQDDFGMDDTEALETLRAIAMLRSDLSDIAYDEALSRRLGIPSTGSQPDQADTTDED